MRNQCEGKTGEGGQSPGEKRSRELEGRKKGKPVIAEKQNLHGPYVFLIRKKYAGQGERKWSEESQIQSSS